jgi:ribosomal protein S18 acetylase RimI-like enzyme
MVEEALPPSRAARWRRAAAAGLTFRRMIDADLPFLARLYASTRADELAPVPWSTEQKAAFLDMQFRAQHQHYGQYFADADRLVILRASEPVGRLYVEDRNDDLHIIDIAFLAQHRGRGLGTALMQDLLDEAAGNAKAVTIHVEKNNPAMRLYLRLGFERVEDLGVYDFMRSIPPAQVNTAS